MWTCSETPLRRARIGAALLALASPAVAAAQADLVTVPSGQTVTFQDMTLEGESPARVARFRFLAPAIARGEGALGFPLVEGDMAHLCEVFALPYLADSDALAEMPAQLIISLSDRPVALGVVDPEATQFFEAYRHDQGNCVWEGF